MMKITYAPHGILQIDDARLVYRNFAGVGSKFNREGDRNFSVMIPAQDIADRLIEDGWNVRIKPPRDEDDTPFMHLPVKVKFNDRGPAIYLVCNGRKVKLDESTVACLDDIDIASVDLDIRPYNWEVKGECGRSAYLHAIRVTQQVDRFADRFGDDESEY